MGGEGGQVTQLGHRVGIPGGARGSGFVLKYEYSVENRLSCKKDPQMLRPRGVWSKAEKEGQHWRQLAGEGPEFCPDCTGSHGRRRAGRGRSSGWTGGAKTRRLGTREEAGKQKGAWTMGREGDEGLRG